MPAGIPVVGGTPDLQSAAIGSGAVRDFEGHLYVGTSSWLTCHVPFKKTDLFHGIASLPSPLPGKYYVADEQEVAGGCLDWLREHALETGDDLPTTRRDRRTRSRPGSNGVIFTPWLNGERTPVDDHTLRAGWHNLSLATTRAELVRSVLEGVAYNSRWLLGDGREVHRAAVPVAALHRRRSAVGAVVPDHGRRARPARSARSSTRSAPTRAAPRCWRARARPDRRRRPRAQRSTSSRRFEPDPANRAVYDERYAEFRVLHKQTSRRTKRHARRGT